MRPDIEPLSTFARSHHGLFRLSDAQRFGLATHDLTRATASGWCVAHSKGLYRITGAPTTLEQRSLAAVWASSAEAVASHLTAGEIMGLPIGRRGSTEISRLHGRNHALPGVVVHRTRVLPDQHRTVVRQIPTTTVARTLFDLSGVVRPARLDRLIDHALQRKLCTLDQVHQAFYALARRGRAGTSTMRAALEARGAGYVATASELERRARALFRTAGLPVPVFEINLGDVAWIGRVDCLWREHRVIVELDGRRYHEGLTARTDDRLRDNRLMAAGWRVIRVTWDDLVHRPQEVIAWIRDALRAAS